MTGTKGAPVLTRVVDELLEATVVGSFSSIGIDVRSRTAGWGPPPSLEGKVVLVTGATSGVGQALAIGVARLGATVRCVARDPSRAAEAQRAISEAAPGADVSFLLADMGEFQQVRRMADRFMADHDRLDVVVHNAGALSSTYTTTGSGLETTVAAQLVGPFLLTGLVLPLLGTDGPSRVLQMSSGGMYTQRFDLAQLDQGADGYVGSTAYARVKRAQLVLMHEWVRRIGDRDVRVHAMHPGWADTPGIRHALPQFARRMRPILRSPAQGADTAIWLSSSEDGQTSTGRFWLDRRPRWEHKLPWTWLSPEQFRAAGADLWRWCVEQSGWDGLDRAR